MEKEKNNYETYRNQLSKEEYFKRFKTEDAEKIGDELKEDLYQKYIVKCIVFNRDNFKCQNINCKAPDSPLTMHHVKWQKNGGKDSQRNCVILCMSCHKNYHRGKFIITFNNNEKLPQHIKGHTFRLEKADEVDWKQIKNDMKKIRKQLKYSTNVSKGIWYKIEWSKVEHLMKILEEWLKEY